MFGIAIYLLMTQGSSHGIVWGGRYGNKLEGTLNGYGVLAEFNLQMQQNSD